MANNLMICSSVANALRLNESENSNQRYILEGTFAELDKLNRNQRIYTKAEYLKHLAYLRNDIKSGEPLLGELDHPDDRFEVKMKEASHRVIDLWYDESDNTVKGKIELLNTPNGKLAQSIVDQGIPLHISSRAAGTVNSDNTVSIQQIYTYDLVCKPGFAGAVLHRVNESADVPQYSEDVRNFLNSSIKMESMNAAPQYGFVNEDVAVSEIKAAANLRKEAKDLQINNQIEINIDDMKAPLYENDNPDATVGKPLDISGNGAAALGIPTALEGDDKNEEDKKDDKEDVSDKKEEEETCPKCGKKPCECDKKEDTSEADDTSERDADKKDSETAEKLNDDKDTPDVKDDDKKEDEPKDDDKKDDDSEGDKSDDDKKDSGVEIIEVEAEFEGDKKDDMIKDVEPDFSDDDSDKNDDEYDDAKKEGGEPESDTEDSKDEAEKTVDVEDDKEEKKAAEEEEKKAKEADELAEKSSKDLADRKDKIMDKLDKLRDAIEKKNNDKKESKNESLIMAQYPISMRLTESNFAEFAKLDESQKSKVVAYLYDNGINDAQSINENWNKGIDYVNETPVWLANAPAKYKELYEAASDQVKESLKCTASYILFESQYDVNVFWENSGLAEANERKLLNESFINNAPKVTPAEKETNLPYGADYIKQITEMACEYNRKY